MSGLWIPALRETTTATGAPPDEYERPDDLKEISINRIEASSLKAAAAADPGPTFQDTSSAHSTDTAEEGEKEEGHTEPVSFEGKLRMSVFGQILEGISQWDDRPLRRSFIHMQDAGQARAFFVKFTGTAYRVYIYFLLTDFFLLTTLSVFFFTLSYSFFTFPPPVCSPFFTFSFLLLSFLLSSCLLLI